MLKVEEVKTVPQK